MRLAMSDRWAVLLVYLGETPAQRVNLAVFCAAANQIGLR